MLSETMTLIADIAMGGAAIKLAWSADRATQQLKQLLAELTRRVESLEDVNTRKRMKSKKTRGRGAL